MHYIYISLCVYKVILEYLEKDAASHVLFLDADVIMHTKPKMHPTKALLDLMLLTSSDMMFADEDWDTYVKFNFVI